MAQDALTAQAEIARLKFQLARYRRAEFGRSSEKLARRHRAARAGARGAGDRPGGAARNGIAGGRRSSRDRGRGAEAGTAPAAGPSAQRGSEASRAVHLSQLRRRAAQDRRRGDRDPRLRAGPVQGRSGTFARNCRAGPATRWWRRRRPTTRSPAAAPGRGYWPISSSRSMTTTCRSIARPRSSPATG